MADELTDEQKAELKEAFSLFDRDGDGTIALDEMQIVMRSIGKNPSIQEIKDMMKEVDPDNEKDEINFLGFLELMAKKMKEGEMDEELVEAFKTFDK